MQQVHLWLRDEVKPFEQRTALTPSDAEKLIKQFNFKITVEKSTTRAFGDEEYTNVGCQLVESHSWIHQAPKIQQEHDNFYILGLKELPLGNTQLVSSNGDEIQVPHLLSQRHIFFAHCFKRQSDWKDTMSRFVLAQPRQGQILDLEFLNLDNGRRVAAFGYAAGFNGMAMGLITYCKQHLHSNDLQVLNETVQPFKNRTELVNYIKDLLSKLNHQLPKCLVLGALGRCGSGSVKCAELCGIPESHLLKWDLQETKCGGPFPQLSTDVDILVNDIYLSGEIKPFLTMDMCTQSDRRLSVFVDVSCDVTNPFNPFPINNQVTTFDKPVRRVVDASTTTSVQPPLDVIAIDHLPTMTPQESSDEFSNALVHYLSELRNVDFSSGKAVAGVEESESVRVWLRANQLFEKKIEEFKQEENL